MECVNTADLHQDERKWQYVGNREDFCSASSSDQVQDKGYSAEEKGLVRRIDLLAMPIICMPDFLQVIQFSLLSSIFYISATFYSR
jgi:hypothetical protein